MERAAGGGGVFEGVTAYVHGTGSVPSEHMGAAASFICRIITLSHRGGGQPFHSILKPAQAAPSALPPPLSHHPPCADGRDLVRLLEAGGARVLGRLPPAGELGRVKLLVPGNHAENCSKEVARAAKELKVGGRRRERCAAFSSLGCFCARSLHLSAAPGAGQAEMCMHMALQARAGGRHILTWDWVFDSVSHWRQLPEKGKYVYK